MLRALDKKERCSIAAAHGHFPHQCPNDCLLEHVCSGKKKRNERLRGSLKATHAFAGVQLPPCALIRVARGSGHASAVLRSRARRWQYGRANGGDKRNGRVLSDL